MKSEDSSNKDPRVCCFHDSEAEAAFEESVSALIALMQKKSRQMYINEENILRMNHGQAWVHSARDPEPNTSMHRMSAEWSVPYAKIVENDLGLIASTLVPVKDELDRQFASNIYSVVGAAADRVGNVVEAKKAGSFAESMLEMLEKIELGVDREGNVSMPQIHAGPDAYEKIVKEIDNVPQDISDRIEKLKEKKIQEALEREEKRKNKFKRDT